MTVAPSPNPASQSVVPGSGLTEAEADYLSGIARGFRDQPALLAWSDDEWLTRGSAMCGRIRAGEDLGDIINNEALAATPDSAFIAVGGGTEATFTLCPEFGETP
jgi:hypothetical protein